MRSHRWTKSSKQSGLTLVIGLIMLAVITVVSITVANIVTLDLRIATNQQAAQSAKAAAESGIDFLLNNPAQLDQLAPFSYVNDPREKMAPVSVSGPANSGWSASVTVQRMGDPLPCPKAQISVSPTSIDSSKIGKCVYFEITSVGSASRNAEETLTRGFYRKVGGFVSH